MKIFCFHICFLEGREIFRRISLSCYYYHFLYSAISPYNRYPINFKTTNSEKVISPNVIIHSISNPTKYLVTSESKLTIYHNYQFVNWFYGRWNELGKSIYQKSSVAKPIGNLLK